MRCLNYWRYQSCLFHEFGERHGFVDARHSLGEVLHEARESAAAVVTAQLCELIADFNLGINLHAEKVIESVHLRWIFPEL